MEACALAPSTINVRLAAVKRVAYEAVDAGLLSPELVGGIRRVKGAKSLVVRVGNWLTLEQLSVSFFPKHTKTVSVCDEFTATHLELMFRVDAACTPDSTFSIVKF